MQRFATSSSSSGNDELEGILIITRRVWTVYRHLSSAPEALRDLQDGLLSLVGALRLTHEYSIEHQISAMDRRTLAGHISRCNTVIAEVEGSLENLRNQREELEDVARFSRKVHGLAASILSFYEILRRNVQEHILALLEEMKETQTADFPQSMRTDWQGILGELVKFDISEDAILEEYFLISSWLKETYPEEEESRERGEAAQNEAGSSSQEIDATSFAPVVELVPIEASEAEELPGYTPGKKPATTAEKVHALDQATAVMDLEAAGQIATSSSAPPAYTFEVGSDQEMDEEFSHYIHKAIGDELKRRILLHELGTERGPFPYSWLPKSLQVQYAGRAEIFPTMDAKSFTVMGYETAPRCLDEIERLLAITNMSADGNGSDAVFLNAGRCLKTMVNALHKFSAILNQGAGTASFSDLDLLDYEASTAAAMYPGITFPGKDFELAQKSYYLLLTYVMGMIGLLTDIFPGRTYVTRSRSDLDHLWEKRRMNARTAWIEKQLAGWAHIEEAVIKCRNWHRLRPYLHDQAIIALQQWRQAQELLVSSETQDQIELTIVSAFDIPKARLGDTNIQVKLVLYGSNGPKSHVWTRKLVIDTDIVKNTQNPVWNTTIPITCPNWPKMLDLELHDVGIRDKQVSRVRLNFSYIPGQEKNFAGKSLMFALDEEFTLQTFPYGKTDIKGKGKGKETVSPTIVIRLKWAGRFALLEQSGLIMSAPGKMFRPHMPGLPMPFENNDSLPISDERGRPSGSIRSANGTIPVR